MLNQENLIAYRQRWQSVEVIESAERLSSSTMDRWQQLNALLNLAMSLEIVPVTDEFIEDEAYHRWQIIYSKS